MRQATLIALLAIPALLPVLVLSAPVADVAVYGNYTAVAYWNGTIVVYDSTRPASRLYTGEHGPPIDVEVGPGWVLAATSGGWLGLACIDNASWSWLNASGRLGDSPLLRLSEGGRVAAVLAGRGALLLALPSLGYAGPAETIVNRFTDCQVSADGSTVLFVGIATFCKSCIEYDYRSVSLRYVGNSTYMARAELKMVRGVRADPSLTRVYVFHWDSLKEYAVSGGSLSQVWSLSMPAGLGQPAFWGFSPHAKFFYAAYRRGGFLVVYRLQLELHTLDVFFLPWEEPSAMAVNDGGDIAALTGRGAVLVSGGRGYLLEGAAGWLAATGSRFIVAGEEGLTVLDAASATVEMPSLSIEVVDEAGGPLASAQLHVNGTPLDLLNASRATGLVRQGVYHVQATAEGYEPFNATVLVSRPTTLRAVLRGFSWLNVTAVYSGCNLRIRGPGCNVTLLDASGRPVYTSDLCEVLARAAHGNYTLLVSYGDQRMVIPLQLRGNTSLTAPFTPWGVVRISVADEEGNPLEGARVRVLYANGSEAVALSCGASGCSARLPGGSSYTLVASAAGFEEGVQSISTGCGPYQLDVAFKLRRGAGSGQALLPLPPALLLAALLLAILVALRRLYRRPRRGVSR